MHVLSLMASLGYPPGTGLVLYQEQAMTRPFKQTLFAALGSRQEIVRSSVLTLTPYEQGDLFKSISGLNGYIQFVKTGSLGRMPLLIDVQDIHDDPTLLSFRIDDRWSKHKQTMQFLMSGSSGLNEDYLDPSVLPEWTGFQAIPADMKPHHVASADFELNSSFGAKAPLLHPNENYYDRKTDPDLVRVHLDGQLSFVGTKANMKDLISVVAEITLTKESAGLKKQQVLVPHFRWNYTSELQDHIYPTSLKLQTALAVPLKSPEKVKLKPVQRRRNKKAAKERDLYKNNAFHACENLLSLMMYKKRNGKSVMNTLKKSGPELPQLLTQFSSSIAGTGLAIVFSVLYKVACGSVPFSTSHLFTSGFGVGLFWVSWAVNELRDTIIYIGKNSAKLGFEEKEMMTRVDKNVNDIFFRAAASMAVLILRFA